MKAETIRNTCSILFPVVVVGFLVVLGLEGVLAPAALSAEPVGAKITAIDAKAGVVTAKEAASGRAFQFQVKDTALLKSLKVGQKISADLKAMTVTLPAAKPGTKPVQVRILKAEPVGRPAEPVGQPQATGRPIITAKPGGIKSSSVNFSVFGLQPVNSSLMLPDLVPFTTQLFATCSWNESGGQACQSVCPAREFMLPLGTKNISSRPLSGPVRIRVLEHPSGSVVRDWTVTDVAGNGNKLPGCIKKTITFCEPQGPMGTPAFNHMLVVETNANEADKNNNTGGMHLGPFGYHQAELLPGSCP